MILIIDNYDSFTYNLYQMLGSINNNIMVIKNDEYTAEEIINLAPEKIIISPGPGRPKDAGVCEDLILKTKGKIPLLGVCLGHQAICEAFGGEITYAKKLMHGKISKISIKNNNELFKNLPLKLNVGRYHSLCVDSTSLPKNILVIGEDENGEIMAIKHAQYQIYGLQFHPESILTEYNKEIIRNFCEIKGVEQ